MKKKVEKNESLFTDEELKVLKFSDEELEIISDANAIAKTSDMLPEEADDLLNRIDKEFPDDLAGTFEKLAELSQTDPKFVAQLVAMNEVFADVTTVPPTSVESVSVKEELLKEGIANIKKILRKK